MTIYYASYYFGAYEIVCISDTENGAKRGVLKKLNSSFGTRFRLSTIDEDIQIMTMKLNEGEVR